MIDERGRLNYLIKNTSYTLPYLMETWQAAINAAVWTTVLGGTGTVTRDITEEPYQKVILDGPANADTARIYTVAEWQMAPTLWGANTFNKLLIMEWEAKFVTVASIENTEFFMGLAAGAAATRSAMNMVGFCLQGDALYSLTDNGGVEDSQAIAGITLTNWNKYAVVAYNGILEFWVNETMEIRNATAADQPDYNMHGMFYLEEEAGANSGELHVAHTNIRPGVIL